MAARMCDADRSGGVLQKSSTARTVSLLTRRSRGDPESNARSRQGTRGGDTSSTAAREAIAARRRHANSRWCTRPWHRLQQRRQLRWRHIRGYEHLALGAIDASPKVADTRAGEHPARPAAGLTPATRQRAHPVAVCAGGRSVTVGAAAPSRDGAVVRPTARPRPSAHRHGPRARTVWAQALATGHVAFADASPSPALVADEVTHGVQNAPAGAAASDGLGRRASSLGGMPDLRRMSSSGAMAPLLTA